MRMFWGLAAVVIITAAQEIQNTSSGISQQETHTKSLVSETSSTLNVSASSHTNTSDDSSLDREARVLDGDGNYDPRILKVHILPDQVHGLPNQVHGFPDQVHGSLDQFHVLPDQIHGSPDQVHGSPEQIHGLPDCEYGSQRTPPISFLDGTPFPSGYFNCVHKEENQVTNQIVEITKTVSLAQTTETYLLTITSTITRCSNRDQSSYLFDEDSNPMPYLSFTLAANPASQTHFHGEVNPIGQPFHQFLGHPTIEYLSKLPPAECRTTVTKTVPQYMIPYSTVFKFITRTEHLNKCLHPETSTQYVTQTQRIQSYVTATKTVNQIITRRIPAQSYITATTTVANCIPTVDKGNKPTDSQYITRYHHVTRLETVEPGNATKVLPFQYVTSLHTEKCLITSTSTVSKYVTLSVPTYVTMFDTISTYLTRTQTVPKYVTDTVPRMMTTTISRFITTTKTNNKYVTISESCPQPIRS